MARPERLYINRYPARTPRAYQLISDLGIKVGSSNYQPDNGWVDPVSRSRVPAPCGSRVMYVTWIMQQFRALLHSADLEYFELLSKIRHLSLSLQS